MNKINKKNKKIFTKTLFIFIFFSKCDCCKKLFKTPEGLKGHQTRDNVGNYRCHRLQTVTRKETTRSEYHERKENIKNTRLQKHHENVSMGPHQTGSPIVAKEKRCILNLYQSYRDDGILSDKEARKETAKRLQFGEPRVRETIKEKIFYKDVEDNKNLRLSENAYEKLDEEEEDALRKLIHNEMRKCDVKRMDESNESVTYPTVKNLHEAVMALGQFPEWSITTFYNVLLGMNITFKAKSEVDRAILIEDENIIQWRERYLRNMEEHRKNGRPIHFVDESAIDSHEQPRKLLTDNTVESAQDAKDKDLSPGLKWNPSRGNRLLILHLIGPDGLVPEFERIWIRSAGTVQSEDYHHDIDSATFNAWFLENIDALPYGSVVVIDNASIHNTRAPGVPTVKTKKAELQKWLTEQGIDFSPKDYRTKLWEKARNHIKNSPEYYSLDRLVAERRPDITFERLPPYHCELNAIEPV